MSESDFMDITLNNSLCNEDGEIGQSQFEQIMRHEMHLYLQARMGSHVGKHAQRSDICIQAALQSPHYCTSTHTKSAFSSSVVALAQALAADP